MLFSKSVSYFPQYVFLDKRNRQEYNNSCKQGLVAQLGAHHIRIVGVGSSNLLKSTK